MALGLTFHSEGSHTFRRLCFPLIGECLWDVMVAVWLHIHIQTVTVCVGIFAWDCLCGSEDNCRFPFLEFIEGQELKKWKPKQILLHHMSLLKL
jgi:hypothetical protein